MTDFQIVSHQNPQAPDPCGSTEPLIPLPGLAEVAVRTATADDLPFIDALQKANTKAVGFMFTGVLEGHLAKGNVLIAESTDEHGRDAQGKLPGVGYCIGVDKYFKREDVGIAYQMNVAPGSRRGLVGANLLKAMFERWPYGVRLCCCWCAQDLAANRFWEAVGFVPLAFRTGSRGRGRNGTPRVHIFWQKAIRAEDQNGRGPNFRGWWFPSQTGGGAIREDRIVLPIPPGVHWSDAKPAVLPGVAGVFDAVAAERESAEQAAVKQIAPPAGTAVKLSKDEKARRKAERAAQRAAEAARRQSVAAGGLRFGAAAGNDGAGADAGADTSRDAKKQAKREARAAVAAKNDPKLVALARELRDRWLETVAAQPGLLTGATNGKYAVGRALEQPLTETVTPDGIDSADGREGVRVVRVVEPKRLDAA